GAVLDRRSLRRDLCLVGQSLRALHLRRRALAREPARRLPAAVLDGALLRLRHRRSVGDKPRRATTRSLVDHRRVVYAPRTSTILPSTPPASIISLPLRASSSGSRAEIFGLILPAASSSNSFGRSSRNGCLSFRYIAV